MPAINDNSYAGPLTADDLRPYQTWPDYEVEPWHLPHMAVMLQTRQPMAAEAYAHVGADDDNGPPATRLGLLLVMLPWLLAIAGWAVVVAIRN